MKVRALPGPPPFALRLAAASFYIFMRMTLGGEGVKPEKKKRGETTATLIFRTAGSEKREQSGPREPLRIQWLTTYTCELKSDGQCASETANYDRDNNQFSIWRERVMLRWTVNLGAKWMISPLNRSISPVF